MPYSLKRKKKLVYLIEVLGDEFTFYFPNLLVKCDRLKINELNQILH